MRYLKEQHASAVPESASTGLWQLALRRLKRDRIAMFSLFVVLFYLLMLLLSMTGVIAKDWNKEVAVSYAPQVLSIHRLCLERQVKIKVLNLP